MFHLTENQLTSIKLLAKYKYLTSSQFVNIMESYKKRDYLTRALKPLLDMKKPLIAKHDFNPIDGKLESFYYLSKYGKQFLINELGYSAEQIKAPRSIAPVKLKDYHHRKFTIDFHIYLNQWLKSNNGNIIFLNYYFDKSGNNRTGEKNKSVTALNRIYIDKSHSYIPDVNTKFSIDNKEYLYLFEQHNGEDAKRLFKQLYVHVIAISKSVVQKKYKFQKSYRVVVICEFESVKASVIKRLQKLDNIEHYNDFFIFKTNEELQEEFSNHWTLISGETSSFLPESTT